MPAVGRPRERNHTIINFPFERKKEIVKCEQAKLSLMSSHFDFFHFLSWKMNNDGVSLDFLFLYQWAH